MASTTLYDLFGIDRNASAREIRAAYLRLMKQHHPDLNAGGPQGAELRHHLANLNAAFAILRDPRKRSEYDASLLIATTHPVPAVGVGRFQRAPPAGRDPALWKLVAGLSAIVLLVGFAVGNGPLSGSSQPFADVARSGSQSDAQIPLDPDFGAARAQIDVAMKLPPDEAVGFSRRCFAEASTSRRPDRAGLCVIFDNAVLLWNLRGVDEGALPPYFRIKLSRGRHLGALAGSNNDRDEVLDRLRSIALETLVRQVRTDTAQQLKVTKTADQVLADSGEQNPGMGQDTKMSSQLTQNKLDLATQGD